MVEANEIDVVANAPEYGKKTKQQNAKILFRSLISFRQRFQGFNGALLVRDRWLNCMPIGSFQVL